MNSILWGNIVKPITWLENMQQKFFVQRSI